MDTNMFGDNSIKQRMSALSYFCVVLFFAYFTVGSIYYFVGYESIQKKVIAYIN